MNYLDDNGITQVRLNDGDLLYNERPTIRLQFREDGPSRLTDCEDDQDVVLITDLEADALLRGLLRWKLLQDGGGGGAVAQAVQGAHTWARKVRAGKS
jgi:hypothetical protein